MSKVIITGSMGNLGTEVSKHLTDNNYEVIGCDFKLGHDLTDENFVIDFFQKNTANYLVNLYAFNPHVSDDAGTNLFDIDLNSIDRYLKVNLTSLFSVCREFAKNNKRGSIVNVSSTYGLVSPTQHIYEPGKEKHIGYSVSKAAVAHMSRCLAVSLAPNIRVNAIAPGGVEFSPKNDQDRIFKESYEKNTPMKRMMKVHELNGIIEYLCSEKSSYCTGSVFSVDGGWTAW